MSVKAIDTSNSDATALCALDDLVPNAGVCALYGEQQVALFYLPETEQKVFALDNWDPIGKASVISRGLVGDINGRLVVASPLYKQHFDLVSGECLEDDSVRLMSWPVSIEENRVLLNTGGEH